MGRLVLRIFPVRPSSLADRVKLLEPAADLIGIETMDAHIPPTASGEGG
jgi:hypothetical protein